MRLREWRAQRNLSADQAAPILGIASGSTLARYERGARLPRKREMVDIFIATRGAVDPNSFYDLPDLAGLPAEHAA
jgi:transcriptional regulator with XRE-family HTH domain